jgi:S-DNA-T family DNA segregation ATPase FtsK/SpoIIIE
MRKMLEYQSDRIEAVMAQHNISGRVTGGTVTPRWVRFKVLPSIGSKVSRIKGLSEEFATALDASSCRVARQGAAVMIEIPRDNPQPVRLMPLLEHLDELPPVTATLGIADDGAPLLIRLPSPDVAHILVAGTTGSGKTALLRTMALSLAWLHPQAQDLSLVLIDPKNRAFSNLDALPHLARPVIVEGTEAAEALGSLVRLMERRDAMRNSEPPVVVFIDELVDLMMVDARRTNGQPEVEHCITRLVQRGREAGIHVVAATQKPTAAVIGSLVKANFPVRVVGKVSSANDARVAAGWSGTGAERLLGKGDFVAVAEGKTHRFQAAFITPNEIASLVRSLEEESVLPATSSSTPTSLILKPIDRDDPLRNQSPTGRPADREQEITEAVITLKRLMQQGHYSLSQSYNDAADLLGEAQGGRRYTEVVQKAVDRLRAEAVLLSDGRTA